MEIITELDVPAPMRDGTVLRANVFRPAAVERCPVLLTRLPYSKDSLLASMFLDTLRAVRSGYAVVIQDTRGRFASDGVFEPFRHEARDGYDTVRWAAERPWSNGAVGMYGASYFGQTQWLAAREQPAGLRAIAPAVTGSDPLDARAYRGGAFELGMRANWYLEMAVHDVSRRAGAGAAEARRAVSDELDALGQRGYWELPLHDFGPLRRHNTGAGFFDEIESINDARSARALSIVGAHDRVEAAALHIGAWFDASLGGTLSNFVEMRKHGKPAHLLIGPWGHVFMQRGFVGELDFGHGAQSSAIAHETDVTAIQLRWFDHWLRAVPNGVTDEPPVRIFVMGANTWRHERDWPLARAVPTPFYLRSTGRLTRDAPADEQPDAYTYDPRDPVPTRGGALLMTKEYGWGPLDQRLIEDRRDVLVFTSDVLHEDVEVTGPVKLVLWASSSARDTDFVARLCDVWPDGRSLSLTDGIIRARYRNDPRGGPPSLLEPDRPYELEIDLWATSNVFKAGHRMRLHVTSSCFPRWDRNPNTGAPASSAADFEQARQKIFHDAARPSRVVLPVIPA